MQLIVCSLAALAVAILYCLWQAHCQFLLRRRRQLRERVTYMIWVSAFQSDRSEKAAVG